MTPERIMGVLKNFGINIEEMVPQLQNQLIKKLIEAERSAGSRLMITATLDDTRTFFIVCLYRMDESGKLELFRQFDLKNPLELLKKLQENDTPDIAPGSDAETAGFIPGIDTPGYLEGDHGDTGNGGAKPAGDAG